MSWGSPEFVIAIIAISYGAWLINNWVRAKHGYDLEDEFGGKSKKGDSAETRRLRAENGELNEKVDMMQDRMIVLEKIVTDRGYTLSDEIDALRDTPAVNPADNGVPLNIKTKQKD
ncbi:MAG: hypothetical protein ABJP48_07455 [Erythrobacter sp.]